MSVKRILGTMLATRMAGRGKRRGGLGTASMLGGLGRRRSRGMGGKMGLAALGYMAYRAYQDHQSRSATGDAAAASGGRASAPSGAGGSSGSSSGGGIAGMVKDVVDKVTGGQAQAGQDTGGAQAAPQEDMEEEARAAERMSDDTALLLIRAMITAAYSDGSLSMEERQRIVDAIDEADGSAEDRAIMEREIANPKPLDQLLGEVNDEETAEEFYMASRAAIDGESEEHKAYLADLRQRLGLSEEQAAEVEEMAV